MAPRLSMSPRARGTASHARAQLAHRAPRDSCDATAATPRARHLLLRGAQQRRGVRAVLQSPLQRRNLAGVTGRARGRSRRRARCTERCTEEARGHTRAASTRGEREKSHDARAPHTLAASASLSARATSSSRRVALAASTAALAPAPAPEPAPAPAHLAGLLPAVGRSHTRGRAVVSARAAAARAQGEGRGRGRTLARAWARQTGARAHRADGKPALRLIFLLAGSTLGTHSSVARRSIRPPGGSPRRDWKYYRFCLERRAGSVDAAHGSGDAA